MTSSVNAKCLPKFSKGKTLLFQATEEKKKKENYHIWKPFWVEVDQELKYFCMDDAANVIKVLQRRWIGDPNFMYLN